MKNKKLLMMVEVAIFGVIGFVLDKVSFTPWSLGGSISLVILPIAMMAYRWGTIPAIISGIIVGFLLAITGGIILTPVQGALDYFIAFAVIGFAGVFRPLIKKAFQKNSKLIVVWMILGSSVGGFLRLVAHTISGVVYFSQYIGDQNVWVYSIVYNCNYMVPSIILTAIAIYLLFRAAPRLFIQNKTY